MTQQLKMTHDGRMARGKENVEKNILLDNEDTKYYLEHKVGENEKVVEEEKKPKKTKSKKEE